MCAFCCGDHNTTTAMCRTMMWFFWLGFFCRTLRNIATSNQYDQHISVAFRCMPEWCRFRAAYTYYEIIAPYVNKHTHTHTRAWWWWSLCCTQRGTARNEEQREQGADRDASACASTASSLVTGISPSDVRVIIFKHISYSRLWLYGGSICGTEWILSVLLYTKKRRTLAKRRQFCRQRSIISYYILRV